MPTHCFLFAGGASSLHSEQLDKGQKRVPEDTEMAVEALDASCIVKPEAQDAAGAKGQTQESTKGQCGSHSTVFKLPEYAALDKYTFWWSDLKDVILKKILCRTNEFSDPVKHEIP